MNAKDLMIGDWVKFTSKYGFGTGQVVGIAPREGSAEHTTFTIWKKDKEGKTMFFVGVSKNCIDPILLTPEILEKNGWRSKLDGTGEFHLMKPLIGDAIVTKTITGFQMNHGPFNGLSIHYVHELQHALRLCGIEKEITI